MHEFTHSITHSFCDLHIHSKVIASYFANKILVFDQLEFPCETSVLVIRGEHLSDKTSELLKYCTILNSNKDGDDAAWKVLVHILLIFISINSPSLFSPTIKIYLLILRQHMTV